MTATLIPILCLALGLTAGGRETYIRVRNLRAMYALRRTTRSKRLRRQIHQQHIAAEQVRRATTYDPWIDPWIGQRRGGTHLFREI